MTDTPAPGDPTTAERQRLLEAWHAARRRRAQAELGGEEFRAAAAEIARLEVEIAKLDRAAGRG